jgi:hypothetical protein
MTLILRLGGGVPILPSRLSAAGPSMQWLGTLEAE